MRLLYAVFVLSLAALVWAILALTRHVRNHDMQPGNPLHLDGKDKHDDPLKNND